MGRIVYTYSSVKPSAPDLEGMRDRERVIERERERESEREIEREGRERERDQRLKHREGRV